ncbi:hypothetical protein GLOTRDRAFT_42483 [Gloeophyllum trabeum ATCC 11539]|uniref:Actin-like ATPase domain-containing protein n=1 Tax=Gloeophyllum trabeum (strain ATCC 11539 / FP-39264 / Madison 617) TaxID=670483 RepID=S7RLG6_GLOTA|nr:uncharacterized protein GLOTRDRAFT_42483 [Gloeophyllum trabeum ATCC 11539]EPQ55250.1 hypothetical protein GLOTRDRAFT_42483 [Gloeophyllum trabeum ATCC 11539]
MANAQFRKPYGGSTRKLVVALDVGTTCSGVSYSILDPGIVPQILTVTTYPGQTSSGGDSKVPSVLYYDADGVLQAAGQEAENLRESGEAEDNEWIRVEWFKLHLRPKEMNASHVKDGDIPPLPANKTVVDVFADFLAYLFQCVKNYISTAHAAGETLLQSLQGSIDFVMGHPNGWGGLQQQKMRQAAVKAGLVPNVDAARRRVQFVTEGEASLYYCLENGLSSETLKIGNKIMIVDAGGGTVDLSSYCIKDLRPLTVAEVAAPGCRMQGSVFVNQRASAYLFEKLKGSIYDDPQDIENIVRCFENTVKRRFKAATEPASIRFGSRNDNEPDFGISKGILKLTGKEVSSFFDPSLNAIMDAIQEQWRAGEHVDTILFVGGFAASDYLFNSLRRELSGAGTEISRPDGYTNKAVANGAVGFYVDRIVSTRVVPTTYGTDGATLYDASNPEHVLRSESVYTDPAGDRMVPNRFFTIVSNGTTVHAEKEYTIKMHQLWQNLGGKEFTVEADVMSYSGTSVNPQWTDVESGSYHKLCTISSEVSEAIKALQPRRGNGRRTYYQLGFNVVLQFGSTELKAQISWMENVSTHRKFTTA